jgi:hypothetical protein
MSDRILVGDIGGTHARFALVDLTVSPWRIDNVQDIAGDLPDFITALRLFLDRAGLTTLPRAISLAVAGPVTAGTVTLTNRKWRIAESELHALGFADSLLINDFAALGQTTFTPSAPISPDLKVNRYPFSEQEQDSAPPVLPAFADAQFPWQQKGGMPDLRPVMTAK